MASPATIGLCMIARDEAKVLEACLRSALGCVDAIVVVDTGSVDDTCAIAERLGARVVDLPWADDFSAPRNEALRHVSTDWVLLLDADERLASGACEALRHAVGRDDIDVGLLPLHDATTLEASEVDVVSGRSRLGDVLYLPRLFRNVDELRWEGRVHEAPTTWLGRRAGRADIVEAHVVHLGRCREIVESKGKTRRNLDLLERRMVEEPDSFAACGYLVHELIARDESERAREVAEEGMRRLGRAAPTRASAALRLVVGSVLVALGRDAIDAALLAIERGETFDGPHPDYHHLRGRALEARAFAQADDDRLRWAMAARASYEQARTLAHIRYAQQFVRGSASWSSALGAGRCALLASDPESAAKFYEQALSFEESAREARLGVCEALIVAGRAALALERLLGLLDQGPDGWLLAAIAAREVGATSDFELLLGEASKRIAHGYADRRRAHLHLDVLATRTPRS